MSLKRAALLISPFLLVGCAGFQSKPLVPSETAAAFESRTLTNPGLKQFIEAHRRHKLAPWPPRSWDLTLLTLTAFYYHPDLEVARAQWGVAKAGILTAGYRPNPALRFSPAYVPNAESGISPWILGLDFDLPIETAGKRLLRIAQARELSEVARFNLATVAWRVRSRLRASLLSLMAAERTRDLLRQQLGVQEVLLGLLKERLVVGEISQPEVTQAQIRLNQTNLALGEAQRQVAEGRVQLANALGLPLNALEGVEIEFGPLEQPFDPMPLSTAEIRLQALTNRTDILSALAEYESMQSALQLELARQYPDLHLGPGYIFETGQHRWSLVGVSLTLPILHQNQGPIAEAEARREEAAKRFNALQARVISEIDRTLAAARATGEKLTTAEVLLYTQEQQLRAVQALFEAGEVDRLAIESARLEYKTAALARLHALVEAQQALGQLEDAVQRPLEPSIGFSLPAEATFQGDRPP